MDESITLLLRSRAVEARPRNIISCDAEGISALPPLGASHVALPPSLTTRIPGPSLDGHVLVSQSIVPIASEKLRFEPIKKYVSHCGKNEILTPVTRWKNDQRIVMSFTDGDNMGQFNG